MKNQTDRPKKLDKPVIEQAVKKLAIEVKYWLESKNDQDHPLEQVEKELTDCVGFNNDGYEMAKVLESCHNYLPDAELVSILDETIPILYAKYQEALNEWVKANNIKPEFKIGDSVYVSVEGLFQNAEIIKINEDKAEYIVCIPIWGLPAGKGIPFNFEDVYKAEKYQEALQA